MLYMSASNSELLTQNSELFYFLGVKLQADPSQKHD